MKINLCIRKSEVNKDIQIIAIKTFSSALDHLKQAIRSVRITVTDENGPRGGVDKTCSAQISLLSGKTMMLRETASSMHHAIALTAAKAKENLSQLNCKTKTLARRRGRKLAERGQLLIGTVKA